MTFMTMNQGVWICGSAVSSAIVSHRMLTNDCKISAKSINLHINIDRLETFQNLIQTRNVLIQIEFLLCSQFYALFLPLCSFLMKLSGKSLQMQFFALICADSVEFLFALFMLALQQLSRWNGMNRIQCNMKCIWKRSFAIRIHTIWFELAEKFHEKRFIYSQTA